MLTCLLLGLYLSPVPQGPERTVDFVSLRPLLAHRDPLPSMPFGTLLNSEGALDLLPGAQEPDPGLDADQVVSLLTSLQQKATEGGKLDLQAHGDQLFVAGDREPVGATMRAAAQLTTFVLRPIEVSAMLLDWTVAPPPALLSPEELKTVASRNKTRWQGHAVTRAGGRVLLRSSRRVAYVAGAEAAVAEHSEAVGPSMASFFEGVAVEVEVHALAGSQDLVVYAQFAAGQRRTEPRALQDGNPGHPTFDVPDHDSLYGTLSGRLASGGAIALCASGHAVDGPQRLLLVSARYTAPPVDGNLGSVALLPISALVTPALTGRPHPPRVPCPPGESELDLEVDEQGYTWGHVGGDELLDLAHRALGEDFESNGGTLAQNGPFLVVGGPRPGANAVEALLIGLQDRWLVNGALRASVPFRDADDATPALHEVTMPMLQGRTSVLFRGRETKALTGMSVEIAKEASMHHPVFDLVQSGLWLRASIVPGGGAPHADLSLLLRNAAEPRRRPLEPARIGDLNLIDVSVASWQHHGALPPDRDLDLGEGPTVTCDGRARPTSVRIRGFR